MSRTAALVTTVRPDGLAEGLRLVVGLVAGGHDVRVLEVGPGCGLLGAKDERPDDVDDYLRALAEFHVTPRALDGAALRHALLACDRVLRIGDPSRSGEPSVLELSNDWLASVSDEELQGALFESGQVIRT